MCGLFIAFVYKDKTRGDSESLGSKLLLLLLLKSTASTLLQQEVLELL